MKKFSFILAGAFALLTLSFAGCGHESQVIEAPPEAVEEEDEAMGGMTEEEYNKAMEADMQ